MSSPETPRMSYRVSQLSPNLLQLPRKSIVMPRPRLAPEFPGGLKKQLTSKQIQHSMTFRVLVRLNISYRQNLLSPVARKGSKAKKVLDRTRNRRIIASDITQENSIFNQVFEDWKNRRFHGHKDTTQSSFFKNKNENSPLLPVTPREGKQNDFKVHIAYPEEK